MFLGFLGLAFLLACCLAFRWLRRLLITPPATLRLPRLLRSGRLQHPPRPLALKQYGTVAACPSTDACPVCLCEFPSHAHGPESPFHWPSCCHALHLGCVAHLVANVRELRGPTCRAPWPPQAADAFTTACHTHGVQAPQPAPDHDTTSHQYHEALAPRPPVHILPFCCPRLMLVDSGMPCRRLPGRSCQIATCIGHQPAHDKPANGRRRGAPPAPGPNPKALDSVSWRQIAPSSVR